MSRLYDRIIKNGGGVAIHGDDIIPGWNPVVVSASNVLRYWVDNINQPTSVDDITSLCITPPLETMFIEADFGGWIGLNAAGWALARLSGDGAKDIAKDSACEWYMFGPLVTESTKGVPVLSGAIIYFALDKRGLLLSPNWVISNPTEENTPYGMMIKEVGKEKALRMIADTCTPLVVALAFMNIKNVELIENIPPAKLSKKHERKHGTPLTKYYTLRVNSMRTVQRMANPDVPSPMSSKSESIPRSLHIARGHFKDYRDGPGLFGKYRNIFWWDQHVRGTKEAGEIVKDYEVEPPTSESKGD